MNNELKTIKTEEINFYEDTLLGGVDENGEIWLAVNQTCQTLGFDKTDGKNQVTKINNDSVLEKLSLKFQTQVKSEDGTIQNREMLFLSEKAITLWLAKISITDKMRLKYPQLAEKLEKYQLECADVLHKHFMGTQDKKEQFFDNMLGMDIKMLLEQNQLILENNKNLAQTVNQLNEKIIAIEGRDSELNNQMMFFLKRFEIYEHPSIRYTRCVDDFNAKVYGKINIYNKDRLFWEAICNWTDTDFNLVTKQKNKKEWLMENIGIDILTFFTDSVILDKIIKNDKGNWVGLSSFNSDPFGIEKKKILKHWTDRNLELRCCYCGNIIDTPQENVNFNYEHYIPKSKSGSSDKLDNIGICCPDCNKDKNSDTYDDYVAKKNVTEFLVNHKKKWCITYNCGGEK